MINLKVWIGLLFISLCSLGMWIHWYINSDSYRHKKLVELADEAKIHYENKFNNE